MRYKLFLIVVFFTQTVYSQAVVEKYFQGMFGGNGTLELLDDNSFRMLAVSYSDVIGRDGTVHKTTFEITGVYTLKNNLLNFIPKEEIVKDNNKELRRNNKSVKEYWFFKFNYYIVDYYGYKILFANKEIKEESSDKFKYDNHFIFLANKLNESNDRIILPEEFWRNKPYDAQEALILREDIGGKGPEEFKGYFLKEPISGNVIAINEVSFLDPVKDKSNKKRYRIKLNIGWVDGIKPNMVLFGEKSRIRIVDVFAKQSSGYIVLKNKPLNYPIGGRFSTRRK